MLVTAADITSVTTTAVEGLPVTFVFTMSKAADVDVTFATSTSDLTATAGVDYASTIQMVTIRAFSQSAVALVNVMGDLDVEADETFQLHMADVNAGGRPIAVGVDVQGVIVNDDCTCVMGGV